MKVFWPGWETVRIIGRGGFGTVYEIVKQDQNSAGRFRSALKVISIPQSPDEVKAYRDDGYDDGTITNILRRRVDSIVREFELLSQFRGTSHIVSYEDHMIVEHAAERSWDILIRMELLKALPDYLNEKKSDLEEAEVRKLGAHICRALELCGRQKIIHRDIKPQNIFINSFMDFKLGDFGIARTIKHTTHATRIGTLPYLAPEVYESRPYGASVDTYSLGLVLYWLLNMRRHPFLPLPPLVPTPTQIDKALERRLKGNPLPPPAHGSADLQAIVLKACAYRPEDRYASPAEMRDALEAMPHTSVKGEHGDATELVRGGDGPKAEDGGAKSGKGSGAAKPVPEEDGSITTDGSTKDGKDGGTKGGAKPVKRILIAAGVVAVCAAAILIGVLTKSSGNGRHRSDKPSGSTAATSSATDNDSLLSAPQSGGLEGGVESSDPYFDALGRQIRIDWCDENNNIIGWDDYEYDAYDDICRVTHHLADGTVIEKDSYVIDNKHNARGLLIEAVYRNLNGMPFRTETYEYNAKGFLTKITFYNAVGNLESWSEYKTDANGDFLERISYDAAGNVSEAYIYDE